MKSYVAPRVQMMQFSAENVLAFSITNPGQETPILPFDLPKVDIETE